jgi:hypothetical protein
MKISGDMTAVLKHTVTKVPLNGRPHIVNINYDNFAEKRTVPLVQMSSTVLLNVFFNTANLGEGGRLCMKIPINGCDHMNITTVN